MAVKKEAENVAIFSYQNKVHLYDGIVKTGLTQSNIFYTIDEAVDKIGYGFFQYRLMFLSGLVWIADAIEIIILSVIGQYLACDWNMYRWQNALLTSSVFTGMCIGCPVFGTIADKWGRKKSIFLSLVLLFLFGAVSAASPSYYWMLGFRTLTGFALGGVAQVLTLSTEYFPINMRGKAGFYLCYFWALGTLLLVLLCWVIMKTTNNWRILLVVASLPALLVLLLFKFYPESARYLVVSKNVEAAEKILNRIAGTNGKELPPGHLLAQEDYGRRGRVCDLFVSEYKSSTLIFWYATCAAAFCYYGIAFITPSIVAKGSIYPDINNDSTTNWEAFTDFISCEVMTQQNYIDLLWTSAAELPAMVLMTILIEKVDRKMLLFSSCVISSVFTFLLMLRIAKIYVLAFLFIVRGTVLATFQLLYVMASESFPTTIRAIAMGTVSACARIGGMIIPFVAQVLILSHPIEAVSLLGTVILIAGIAAVFLPRETRGTLLSDSHVSTSASTSHILAH